MKWCKLVFTTIILSETQFLSLQVTPWKTKSLVVCGKLNLRLLLICNHKQIDGLCCAAVKNHSIDTSEPHFIVNVQMIFTFSVTHKCGCIRLSLKAKYVLDNVPRCHSFTWHVKLKCKATFYCLGNRGIKIHNDLQTSWHLLLSVVNIIDIAVLQETAVFRGEYPWNSEKR